MLETGFSDRIMLAMDCATRSIWRNYGGGPGLDYLLRRFVPRLMRARISEEDITAMLVVNPARAFAFRQKTKQSMVQLSTR